MSETYEFKLPKRVTDAIEAYNATHNKAAEQRQRVESRNGELVAELAKAKADLQAAMDAVIENPCAQTEAKETELRRKVAELTMSVSGGSDRASRAFIKGSADLQRLAKEAIAIGKEEGRKHWDANVKQRLQAVADAKYAYLKSLVDLKRLQQESYSMYYEAGRQTNENLLKPEESPHYHVDVLEAPLSTEIYGTLPAEITRAAKQGLIYRRSCGLDRAIE